MPGDSRLVAAKEANTTEGNHTEPHHCDGGSRVAHDLSVKAERIHMLMTHHMNNIEWLQKHGGGGQYFGVFCTC